ncbi:MAG: class I SAM-dependent methyltransferase [Planctomycetota bacterium]|nr:class I SAM-dependent methyltransferase [Planctomycetota bacterium]
MIHSFYGTDVSYIHDCGFSHFVDGCCPGLLQLLQQHGITRGRIVDVGCGGGISTAALAAAGFETLGIDQSAAMIKLARQRLPAGQFTRGSLDDQPLPECQTVIAVGEVLNYTRTAHPARRLAHFFSRVHRALSENGLLIFDIREPLKRSELPLSHQWQGGDWTCLVRQELARRGRTLTRHVTTFRQLGKLYRRQDEIHVQSLYSRNALVTSLRTRGFQVQTRRSYGNYRLHDHRLVVVAKKATKRRSLRAFVSLAE